MHTQNYILTFLFILYELEAEKFTINFFKQTRSKLAINTKKVFINVQIELNLQHCPKKKEKTYNNFHF